MNPVPELSARKTLILSGEHFDLLCQNASKVLDFNSDSLRTYSLCAQCRKARLKLGQGPPFDLESACLFFHDGTN